MNANLMKKTIEMSKSEAKKAGKIGTPEFKELRAYQELYPTYTVEIKAPAKRKNEYKGLTYDYMKSYIKEHDDGDGKKMEQFLSLIGQDKDGKIEDALFVDFANDKIVMTTTFAKKCQNTASAEYAQLQSVRRDYPTFAVTTRKIKSNPNKETYAGLTYEYMRNYIITHASEETREKEVAEFDELVLISKCQTKAKRYPTIKKWFLAKYPAIAKFGMDAEVEADNKAEEAKRQNVIPMAEVNEAA